MLSQRESGGEVHACGARITITRLNGKLLAGPLSAGEGILYANASIEDVLVSKFVIDVAGHNQHPELFAHDFEAHLRK